MAISSGANANRTRDYQRADARQTGGGAAQRQVDRRHSGAWLRRGSTGRTSDRKRGGSSVCTGDLRHRGRCLAGRVVREPRARLVGVIEVERLGYKGDFMADTAADILID